MDTNMKNNVTLLRATISSLPTNIKRDILVLYHVPGMEMASAAVLRRGEKQVLLNLSAHCHSEKDEEIYDKNRPVDGNIKHLKECTEKGDESGAGGRKPVK